MQSSREDIKKQIKTYCEKLKLADELIENDFNKYATLEGLISYLEEKVDLTFISVAKDAVFNDFKIFKEQMLKHFGVYRDLQLKDYLDYLTTQSYIKSDPLVSKILPKTYQPYFKSFSEYLVFKEFKPYPDRLLKDWPGVLKYLQKKTHGLTEKLTSNKYKKFSLRFGSELEALRQDLDNEFKKLLKSASKASINEYYFNFFNELLDIEKPLPKSFIAKKTYNTSADDSANSKLHLNSPIVMLLYHAFLNSNAQLVSHILKFKESDQLFELLRMRLCIDKKQIIERVTDENLKERISQISTSKLIKLITDPKLIKEYEHLISAEEFYTIIDLFKKAELELFCKIDSQTLLVLVTSGYPIATRELCAVIALRMLSLNDDFFGEDIKSKYGLALAYVLLAGEAGFSENVFTLLGQHTYPYPKAMGTNPLPRVEIKHDGELWQKTKDYCISGILGITPYSQLSDEQRQALFTTKNLGQKRVTSDFHKAIVKHGTKKLLHGIRTKKPFLLSNEEWGIIYLSIQSYNSALHFLTAALEGNELSAKGYFMLGKCYIELRNSETDHHKALSFSKTALNSYKVAADLKYGPAMKELFEIYKLNTKNHELNYYAGLYYLYNNQNEEAMACFKFSLQKYPKAYKAYFDMLISKETDSNSHNFHKHPLALKVLDKITEDKTIPHIEDAIQLNDEDYHWLQANPSYSASHRLALKFAEYIADKNEDVMFALLEYYCEVNDKDMIIAKARVIFTNIHSDYLDQTEEILIKLNTNIAILTLAEGYRKQYAYEKLANLLFKKQSRNDLLNNLRSELFFDQNVRLNIDVKAYSEFIKTHQKELLKDPVLLYTIIESELTPLLKYRPAEETLRREQIEVLTYYLITAIAKLLKKPLSNSNEPIFQICPAFSIMLACKLMHKGKIEQARSILATLAEQGYSLAQSILNLEDDMKEFEKMWQRSVSKSQSFSNCLEIYFNKIKKSQSLFSGLKLFANQPSELTTRIIAIMAEHAGSNLECAYFLIKELENINNKHLQTGAYFLIMKLISNNLEYKAEADLKVEVKPT